MESLSAAFADCIRTHQLIAAGDKILLAVSGGVDSMVMARLFKDTGIPIGIAHVNFNLRGRASDNDQAVVERMANRWKVPFHPLNADTREFMKRHKLSLQEAAREIRYKWFEEVAQRSDYQRIATAHHLDDSIETFFINLLRGTGIHGLTGIPVQHGKIIRPMLFATNKNIRSFASKHRIKFREDTSNQKDDYLRNRIRHHLIPLLVNLQPSLQQVMKANLSRLEFARDRFDERMGELQRLMVRNDKEDKTMSIPELLNFRQSALLLHELLKLEGAEFKEPEKLLVTGKPGKVFKSGTKKIIRDRTKLILQGSFTEQHVSETVYTLPCTVNTRHGEFNLLEKDYVQGEEHHLASQFLLLDAAKIRLPFEIRSWQAGDRIRPLGMKQQKKVSDLLTDLKLSIAAKARTLVAVHGSEICCILGVRISDDYKVTRQTKKVVLISRQPVHS